ncbi:iron ABC transporter permease [Pikeienuella piscinae]|uniref:Iron ABC transporter permease n=1 Tax=Pikeienuella piscinae TaxID=2748098 RepID=A0A7L5BUS8_9RHOB|nr:iron ABC transporter permease [Pikeienuella piscinae]QIE54187.1 iron ABC transporter permease [Pikeienuella piscinae]
MPAAARQGQGQQMALTTMILALIVLFSLLPMLRLLQEIVLPGGTFSIDAIRDGLGDRTAWIATRNSLVVGIGGGALAVILGTTVALLVTLTDIRGTQMLVLCYVTPLMIAPQVIALAWLQVFGPSSPLLHLLGIAPPIGTPNPLYSAGGIILLLGLHYGPLVFLIVRAGLRKLPRELVEAAQAGGAGPLKVVVTIVLPLMTPSIAGAAALAFVSCVGNFGIPAFLGIPANYTVLPTLIFRRLAGGGPEVLSDVAYLSVLIGIIAMAGIAAQDWVGKRRDFRITTTSVPPEPYRLGRWRIVIGALMWTLIVGVLVLPLVGLILTSLVRGYGVVLTAASATLDNYRFILTLHEAARRAFVNSLMLAATAAVFSVFAAIPVAYLIAWGRTRWVRWLNFAIELPYALPGVVLAIAALLMFLKPIPLAGFSIYNTVWIILFAYLARFLVLAIRPTVNGYAQLDRALEEAAEVAGAGLFTRLRTIIFPLVAPAAMAGGLLIFMTALSELTVSALLWSSGSETIGVVIFSFEQGGDSKYAAALSVIVVAITFLLMLSATLFAKRLPEGVLPWKD